MSISVERPAVDGLSVVTLTGEHDIATAHQLRRVLSELSSATPLVVLDLAACQFIDSTILGVVAAAAKRLGNAGGRVVAINTYGVVAKAMHVTGLDRLLTPSAVLDSQFLEALEQLGWHPPSTGSTISDASRT